MSRSKVEVIGQSHKRQNVTEMVGATSSEGLASFIDNTVNVRHRKLKPNTLHLRQYTRKQEARQ